MDTEDTGGLRGLQSKYFINIHLCLLIKEKR